MRCPDLRSEATIDEASAGTRAFHIKILPLPPPRNSTSDRGCVVKFNHLCLANEVLEMSIFCASLGGLEVVRKKRAVRVARGMRNGADHPITVVPHALIHRGENLQR